MMLPSHADVVVIGGGIIGCSTAYHLARDHKQKVLLLEQNRLTSGRNSKVARMAAVRCQLR